MQTPQAKPLTVLIVEDQVESLEIFALVLQVHGYAVVTAANGAIALEQLGRQPVDIVLTDLLMPVMDGLDLATTLKADSRYAHLPIVLLTASQLPLDFNEKQIFVALLTKPCSPDQLTDSIDAVAKAWPHRQAPEARNT